MQQIYRTSDGKIFDSKKEAIKHDFKINKNEEKFIEMVNKVLDYMSKEYGLEFRVDELKSYVDWDQDPNSEEMNYVVYQELDINIFKDGKKLGYSFSRSSSNGYYNETNLKEALIKEYVHPYLSVFEGVLNEEPEIYGNEYSIGDFSLEMILPQLVGKKVRLQVINE